VERASKDGELEELKRNIQTMTNIKKQTTMLPPEQEVKYRELLASRKTLEEELGKIREELGKIEAYLEEISIRGKVSASTKLYPGVKIYIQDVLYEVKNDYSASTFVLEDGLVKMIKYEEADPEKMKVPDAAN